MPRQAKGVNKASIEESAIMLFSSKGYINVSMDQIASQAGISKRTIYQYFPSKMAILLNIIEISLKEINEAMVELACKEFTALEWMKAYLSYRFQYSLKNSSFMIFLWSNDLKDAGAELAEEWRKHINMWNESIFRIGADTIRQKDITGWFAKYTPEQIMELLSSMNKGMIMQLSKDENLGGRTMNAEEILKQYLELIELGMSDKE